jgi:hypothetical protein
MKSPGYKAAPDESVFRRAEFIRRNAVARRLISGRIRCKRFLEKLALLLPTSKHHRLEIDLGLTDLAFIQTQLRLK